MGADNAVSRSNGQVIDQDFFNLFNRILQGDFLGRDGTGAPAALQNLGSPSIPWGTARITDLILGGAAIDPSLITAPPNRIISGAKKATSDFPDFLRPAGAGNGNNFDTLGLTTNIVYDVNGLEFTISTDINVSSLTLAPSSNNTLLINDAGLTGQDSTKNLGEDGTEITVDNMGSAISTKVGEFVALKNQTSGEIMYCLVESTTKLSSAKRGFVLDETGTPINRAVLNNNEQLNILSLAFVFIDLNTTTVDVTYRNPSISSATPGSPQTGDYWLDTNILQWKRYNGATFVSIDRTFAGYVVIDTADALGARSEYFSKTFFEDNSLSVNLKDVDTISSDEESFLLSIDGNLKQFNFSFTEWAAGTDFESGVLRTVSTAYYLYITEDGAVKISDKKPYDLRGVLKGFYHPFESWRSVGEIFNDGADEFTIVNTSDKDLETKANTISEVTPGSGVTVDGVLLKDSDMNADSVSGSMLAVASEIATGTDNTKVVTPQSLSGVTAKAWANYKGSGTVAINDSHNISSMVDNGVGIYTFNYSSNLGGTDPSIAGTSGNGSVPGGSMTNIHTATVSTMKINVVDVNGALADRDLSTLLIFGD